MFTTVDPVKCKTKNEFGLNFKNPRPMLPQLLAHFYACRCHPLHVAEHSVARGTLAQEVGSREFTRIRARR